MKNTEQLTSSTFYHVYNRGVDGRSIFEKDSNYSYFLRKYDQYIGPIANTYAYCLLGNHFHLLICTKNEDEIIEALSCKSLTERSELNISKKISLQFSHFFNGYTQAFNRQQGRKGKLFELPFRRVAVATEAYFSRLVFYIHANPQTHGLIYDFRKWPHSSYKSHLSDKPTKLKRKSVLNWFGGHEAYKQFHAESQNFSTDKKLLLED